MEPKRRHGKRSLGKDLRQIGRGVVHEMLERRVMLAVTPVSLTPVAGQTVSAAGGPLIDVALGDITGDSISDFVGLGGQGIVPFQAVPYQVSAGGTATIQPTA